MVREPALPVTAEPKGEAGILLLPKHGRELPNITVRNDRQQLQVIYGGAIALVC
jgi:hypothetical protein